MTVLNRWSARGRTTMKPIIRKIAIDMTPMLLLLVGVSAATAQGNAATLIGTVNDPTGAVIPKATIAITDEASTVVRPTKSDERRLLFVRRRTGGHLRREGLRSGFNSLLRQGIAVHINDQIELKRLRSLLPPRLHRSPLPLPATNSLPLLQAR